MKCTTDFSTKRAMVNAIQETGDPLAAIKLQDAYAASSSVGKLFVPMANHEEVKRLSDKLLQSFTDDELDKANPNLIIALSGMLAIALIYQGRAWGIKP